ncbi:MAG: hypothetical protein FWD61_14080 [Phycisphaerales bacterium]|nr:hypothetical protein [Phycisphaerales bacterium]
MAASGTSGQGEAGALAARLILLVTCLALGMAAMLRWFPSLVPWRGGTSAWQMSAFVAILLISVPVGAVVIFAVVGVLAVCVRLIVVGVQLAGRVLSAVLSGEKQALEAVGTKVLEKGHHTEEPKESESTVPPRERQSKRHQPQSRRRVNVRG